MNEIRYGIFNLGGGNLYDADEDIIIESNLRGGKYKNPIDRAKEKFINEKKNNEWKITKGAEEMAKLIKKRDELNYIINNSGINESDGNEYNSEYMDTLAELSKLKPYQKASKKLGFKSNFQENSYLPTLISEIRSRKGVETINREIGNQPILRRENIDELKADLIYKNQEVYDLKSELDNAKINFIKLKDQTKKQQNQIHELEDTTMRLATELNDYKDALEIKTMDTEDTKRQKKSLLDKIRPKKKSKQKEIFIKTKEDGKPITVEQLKQEKK